MRKRMLAMGKLTAIFVITTATLWGQGASARGAFPLLGVDARGLAMGGAFTALVQGAPSAYWNPAALAFLKGYDFTGMYAHFGDLPLKGGFAAVAQEDKGYGAGALSWEFVGLKAYDETVKWNENCVSYAFAREFSPGIAVGGRLKFLFNKTDIEGADVSGGSADAAFLGVMGAFRFGMIIRDLISRLKWGTGTKESLPPSYQMGASYSLLASRINAELDISGESSLPLADVRFGVEVWPVPEVFALRGGLIHKMSEYDKRNIFSAGFGIRLTQGLGHYNIDYAFVADRDVLGPSHRISVGASW